MIIRCYSKTIWINFTIGANATWWISTPSAKSWELDHGLLELLKKTSAVYRVHLSDPVLEEVKEFKDLGILTISGLSWNSHSDMITAKANRMLGLINRACMDLKD